MVQGGHFGHRWAAEQRPIRACKGSERIESRKFQGKGSDGVKGG